MAAIDIKNLVIITTLIFLIAPVFLLLYISIYNKRKKKHIEEKEHLHAEFKEELLKTQIEIQEQTLTHVSREIHDNITQVLSFVKLNLALTAREEQGDKQLKINESRDLVAQVINDLRNLSKSLSFEQIGLLGLVKMLEIEAEKVTATGILTINISVEGEVYPLGEQRELVLFRIFQETLNNALKHAGAQQLNISLQYSDQIFILTLADDGAGFLPDNVKMGSGLKNMENRAKLIGADMHIASAPGQGCRISVKLHPLKPQVTTDATYTNSAGR